MSILRLTLGLLVAGYICASDLSARSETLPEIIERASKRYEAGQYDEALPLFQRALKHSEQVPISEPLSTVAVLGWILRTYNALGRCPDAEALFNRTLDIYTQEPDIIDTAIAINLDEVIACYLKEELFDAADLLFHNTEIFVQSVQGSNGPVLGTLLNNHAIFYEDIFNYEVAESLYRRAVAIEKKMFSSDDPESTIAHGNLAALLQRTGQHNEAAAILTQAISTIERLHGQYGSSLAMLLVRLANIYIDIGRYAEAESLCHRAIVIDEKTYGMDHPALAMDLSVLAKLFFTTGRYTEAESIGPSSRDL